MEEDPSTVVEQQDPDPGDDTTVSDAAAEDGGGDSGPSGDTPATAKPAGKKPAPSPLEQALATANREAATRRHEIKKLTDELDALKTANASEQEKALLAAKKEAAEARDQVLRPAVVRANARAAIAAAGCTDRETQDLMLKMLDSSSIELDENGEVVSGLAEGVEMLKEKFPERFSPPTQAGAVRPPSARRVDAGEKKPPPQPKTASQRLADIVSGSGRQ
jgi:hypothetical protein